jgi:nucleotide-binding universal stress UspA family protein
MASKQKDKLMRDMKIAHIVVATDLSAASSFAYPYAAGFAKVFGSRVTLLYVDEISRFSLRTSQDVVDYLNRISAYHRDELEKARDWFESNDIAVEVTTLDGRPSQRILEFAGESEADLLVVAKHGVRGLERMLFGSTSKRVVRKANLPVLVVQPDATADDSAEVIAYVRLLATTDYSADSKRGLKATLLLADKLNAHVKLVNVARVPATSGLPAEVDSLYSDKVEATFCKQ